MTQLGMISMNPSPRQKQILSLIAAGLSNKEIAQSLGVSPRTVDTHLQRLYVRHGVHSRASLVAKWLLEGGVPNQSPATDSAGPTGNPVDPSGGDAPVSTTP